MGSNVRQHGIQPDYNKQKAEAPQAHVEGSNNRPVSVTELETKLVGLRWQVAEAMKRNGTGRAGSRGRAPRGLRSAVRNTKAKLRRLEDAQSIKSAEHGAEPTAATRQAVVTNHFRGSRPATEAPRTEVRRAEAPRTLDHETDSRKRQSFLRYMQDHIVSLDPPSSADTPARKGFLPKGASQDECEAFFGRLQAGDVVIAIDAFGQETKFHLAYTEPRENCLVVYGYDSKAGSSSIFYPFSSAFRIEK